MRCNIVYIAILFFSVQLTSCDLFQTRDPQDPETGSQTNPPATSVDVLLDNFQKSLLHKNTTEYDNLFSDTVTHRRNFIFIPTSSALVRYSSVFASWNKASESRYFNNVISAMPNSSIPEVIFALNPIFEYPSDSVAYSIDYTLFIPHNKENIITQQFAGRCEVYMSPDKNEIWRIYRWVDLGPKKDSSWSDLKGQFRD